MPYNNTANSVGGKVEMLKSRAQIQLEIRWNFMEQISNITIQSSKE